MDRRATSRSLAVHTLVLFSVGVLLLFLIFVVDADIFPEPKLAIALTSGDFSQHATAQDPSRDWRKVILPHSSAGEQGSSQTSTYQLEFDRPQTKDESFSIYIPAVKHNVTLFLDGNWLAQGGSKHPYLARLWNHPQLFTLPKSILKETNLLLVEVTADATRQGYLSKIYIGDTSELKRYWQWRNFVKVTLLEIASVLLLVAALVNFYLWYLRPSDSYYLWYALAALFWGIRGYLLIVPVIPISDELRIALRLVTLGYGIVFVVLFNQRYFGFKNRMFDVAMWVYCVPMTLPLFFMSTEQLLFYGHQIWVRGNLLLGVFIFFHLLVIFFRQRNLDAIYLLYSGLPLLVFGFRDLLVLNNAWSPHNGFLINHLTLPALIVAMWFIIRRLSDSLALSEQLNTTLEHRVRVKEREVRASYQERESMRKQQLLGDERERIMRDMHDGIGGHLIGIKSILEGTSPRLSDVRDYVDRALIDLRFIINSLDPTSQTLTTLLGSLRARWQQLSEHNDRELIWRVSEVGRGDSLGPARTLQIMRILEEAFANALKHGTVGQIVVTSGSMQGSNAKWLEINNPVTCCGEQRIGRGISNMQRRAASIGVNLEAGRQKNHYKVRIIIPDIFAAKKNSNNDLLL